MRDLVRKGWVSEHTRTIQNDDRRQKTWQLTERAETWQLRGQIW